MKRRDLLALLAGVPAAACWPAHAQQSGKVWRVGVLESTSAELNAANLAAFRNGLRELGYVEGRNLTLEYRTALEGPVEQYRTLAADLARLKVDVIVTRGSAAAIAAQDATMNIPIVMAAAAEPLALGLVESLSRPGGNITGLSGFTVELMPKLVEILREIVPGLKRIATLINMSSPVGQKRWEVMRAMAGTFAFEPQLLEVRTAGDLQPAFMSAKEWHADAMLMGLDYVIRTNLRHVVDLAAEHRLPAVYAAREFVEAGGLLSYGANFPYLYFRAASFVDKIFKGARPSDLPVEQPTAVEMVVNLRTARALGLTIPPTLLARADEVIE